MSLFDPRTEHPQAGALLARLIELGPDGWLPQDWGFARSFASAHLTLERSPAHSGMPLLRISAAPGLSPLYCLYSTEHPDLGALWDLINKSRSIEIQRRAVMRALARELEL